MYSDQCTFTAHIRTHAQLVHGKTDTYLLQHVLPHTSHLLPDFCLVPILPINVLDLPEEQCFQLNRIKEAVIVGVCTVEGQL